MRFGAQNRIRFAAALAAADKTFQNIIDDSGLSRSYLTDIMKGNRALSARVEQALRAAVGEPGWAYATGATDVLPAAKLEVAA